MPRREREQDPPVDACCGPRLKRVPLDNSLEKSRPTPVPSELTGHIMMRSAPRYVVRVRLRMSSGALPGPDLLRAIPGVLRRGATGARVRASRGGLGTSINLPVILR